LTSVIAGVLLLAAFVAWERRARMPMLPLSLFTSGAFRIDTDLTETGYSVGTVRMPADFPGRGP
jgi:hypothetical protein